MARLGRPPADKTKSITVKLTEKEYENLRACAVADGLTMAALIRRYINSRTKSLKAAAQWTGETER